jgi:hypothetical protein
MPLDASAACDAAVQEEAVVDKAVEQPPVDPELPAISPSLRDTVFDVASVRDTIIDIESLCAAVTEAALTEAESSPDPLDSPAAIPADASSTELVALAPANADRERLECDADTVVRHVALLPPPEVTHDVAKPALRTQPVVDSIPADDAAPNPALDRLIVRHRKVHRRRVVAWCAAATVLLGVFLTGVRWANENFDFHETTFDFNLETAPPESSSPGSANPLSPSISSPQRTVGEGAFEASLREVPVGEAR